MNAILKSALAVVLMAISAQAVAEITFYEREDFRGQSFTTGETDWQPRALWLQRPRLVGRRYRRKMGGLPRRAVQRPVRCPAPGPVFFAGRDGPERPYFIDAGRE